jgi:hypothetical protein
MKISKADAPQDVRFTPWLAEKSPRKIPLFSFLKNRQALPVSQRAYPTVPMTSPSAPSVAASFGTRTPRFRCLLDAARLRYPQAERGRSSVVERQLPKLYVEGSIPFARSRI